jgi:hypothetical protein
VAQAPVLDRLAAVYPQVPVRAVDAVADAEMARRFGVLTVPSTVGVDAQGRVAFVNYGLTQLPRLQEQVQALQMDSAGRE